jgi:hypothetical protein
MLTEGANRRIRLLHQEQGADPDKMEKLARAFLIDLGGISDQDERILAPGTRSAFFELWSPFWLSPESLSEEVRLELGAAMLVSWTGIAQIDHHVDVTEARWHNNLLHRRALFWFDRYHRLIGGSSNWPALIKTWSLPSHNLSSPKSREEIILIKNPFYPEIFHAYMQNKETADKFGNLYTKVVGILDEAADIVDDFARDRWNYLLFSISVQPLQDLCLLELVKRVLVSGIIHESIGMARQMLSELQTLARASGFHLFASALDCLWPSFENYEEFCIARLISASDDRRRASLH